MGHTMRLMSQRCTASMGHLGSLETGTEESGYAEGNVMGRQVQSCIVAYVLDARLAWFQKLCTVLVQDAVCISVPYLVVYMYGTGRNDTSLRHQEATCSSSQVIG